MRLKLIACEVFVRELCHSVALSPHIIDLEFTPKGAHDNSDNLRELIQNKIKETEASETNYDAILLGFGLCGNSILGLKANKIPLVIPRAHDCCTIFLGSKERFLKYFGERLSSQWTSAGYLERGGSILRETDIEDNLGMNKSYQELVEQYGEDNAKYVWETLHPDVGKDKLIYIEMPELTDLGYAKKVEQEAKEKDMGFEIIKGSIKLIKDLVFANWNQDDFLVVEVGQKIKGVYDQKEIIKV